MPSFTDAPATAPATDFDDMTDEQLLEAYLDAKDRYISTHREMVRRNDLKIEEMLISQGWPKSRCKCTFCCEYGCDDNQSAWLALLREEKVRREAELLDRELLPAPVGRPAGSTVTKATNSDVSPPCSSDEEYQDNAPIPDDNELFLIDDGDDIDDDDGGGGDDYDYNEIINDDGY